MLSKTKGIVLQTIKHSDSGIITHILTREYGLLSFIVKGVHSKKSKTRSAYFQSLQVLNLEIDYKPSRNLQFIREVSVEIPLIRIPYDFTRNSIAFFIGEVLRKSLNENEANEAIYDYVQSSILFLDSEKDIVNFHIGFLVGLTKYLGISPSRTYSEEDCYFDIQNGVYTNSPPLHGYYMDATSSRLLNSFSNSSIINCSQIPLSGSVRSSFLDILITYLAMHLPGLNRIKSLEVLKEVFK